MQNIEKERYSWLKLSIVLLLIGLFGALTAMSEGTEVPMNLDDQAAINNLKILQAIATVVLFIAPAITFAVLFTKSGISYLGINAKPKLKTVVIGGLGMVLALPLINYFMELNKGLQLPESMHAIEVWMQKSESSLKKVTEAFMQGTDTSTLFLNLFVVAFMAALSEELFFRGVLQKLLIDCTKNKHVSVWIGAILFSAFHMQFYGFLPRMMMGAYLGYLFVWSGSLWPGITAHFLNNGLAVYLTWLSNRGTIAADTDTVGTGSEQSIYTIISLIMVVTSMILVYRIEKKDHPVLNVE